MRFPWDPDEIYETTAEGGLLAIGPSRTDELVEWHDLSHMRAFEIAAVLEDEADAFIFIDRQGRQQFLLPLTLEGYERIRLRLSPDNLHFQSLSELKAAIWAAVRKIP